MSASGYAQATRQDRNIDDEAAVVENTLSLSVTLEEYIRLVRAETMEI